MSDEASRRVATRAAREATGRLVALLAARCGDIGLAEDALGDALLAALERWPDDGVPGDAEGWLYAVARRKLVGRWRRAEVRRRKALAIEQLQSVAVDRADDERWPDERLPMLFVCAHPAIAPSIRAPLMLQAVLGMTADDIGPLMGVAPKTMGQRLWRAKAKIREARVPFQVPEGKEAADRMQAVLDAVYGLYAMGWTQAEQAGLAIEAVWLAELVAELMPDQPEAWGLSALLRYVEARRPGGRAEGRYVPLSEQDPRGWDDHAIDRADATLRRAAALGRMGPFQLEAAIQSALVHGARQGHVDREAVAVLYEGLADMAPTLGILVGRAAAIAEHRGARAGLEALVTVEGAELFQPFWAVQADLLQRLGDPRADESYQRALTLTRDPSVAAYLEAKRALG